MLSGRSTIRVHLSQYVKKHSESVRYFSPWILKPILNFFKRLCVSTFCLTRQVGYSGSSSGCSLGCPASNSNLSYPLCMAPHFLHVWCSQQRSIQKWQAWILVGLLGLPSNSWCRSKNCLQVVFPWQPARSRSIATQQHSNGSKLSWAHPGYS